MALVASSRRDLLLRVHRHRLRKEDLEDCYGQATLELLVHVGQGGSFKSRAHVGNALEQRFLSRIRDRRRAVGGRSPMQAALEGALPLATDADERPIEVADVRMEPQRVVMLRHELRRLQHHAHRLTADQRLVLACQVGLQMDCQEFCGLHGWTPEKYRKVAQRARARLRELMLAEESSAEQAIGSASRGPLAQG